MKYKIKYNNTTGFFESDQLKPEALEKFITKAISHHAAVKPFVVTYKDKDGNLSLRQKSLQQTMPLSHYAQKLGCLVYTPTSIQKKSSTKATQRKQKSASNENKVSVSTSAIETKCIIMISAENELIIHPLQDCTLDELLRELLVTEDYFEITYLTKKKQVYGLHVKLLENVAKQPIDSYLYKNFPNAKVIKQSLPENASESESSNVEQTSHPQKPARAGSYTIKYNTLTGFFECDEIKTPNHLSQVLRDRVRWHQADVQAFVKIEKDNVGNVFFVRVNPLDLTSFETYATILKCKVYTPVNENNERVECEILSMDALPEELLRDLACGIRLPSDSTLHNNINHAQISLKNIEYNATILELLPNDLCIYPINCPLSVLEQEISTTEAFNTSYLLDDEMQPCGLHLTLKNVINTNLIPIREFLLQDFPNASIKTHFFTLTRPQNSQEVYFYFEGNPKEKIHVTWSNDFADATWFEYHIQNFEVQDILKINMHILTNELHLEVNDQRLLTQFDLLKIVIALITQPEVAFAKLAHILKMKQAELTPVYHNPLQRALTIVDHLTPSTIDSPLDLAPEPPAKKQNTTLK